MSATNKRLPIKLKESPRSVEEALHLKASELSEFIDEHERGQGKAGHACCDDHDKQNCDHNHHEDCVEGEYEDRLERSMASARAREQLTKAFCIGLVSSLLELIGGILIGSLAVVADAVHDGFDVMSFALSLLFLRLAEKKGNKIYTYGWLRGEVLGAIISLGWIYVVTAGIVFEAVSRIKLIVSNDPSYSPVSGFDMLLLGVFGLLIDLLIIFVFRKNGGGHSHPHGGFDHHHHHHHKNEHGNVNVAAAYVHALSHAVQDIGVIIAALIMWGAPDAQLADPITTIVFAALSLLPTHGVWISIGRVLLQGAPMGCDVNQVYEKLMRMKYVAAVRDLHIWSLGSDTAVLTVSLRVLDFDKVARSLPSGVKTMLRKEFGIKHATIQVEPSDDTISGEFDSCYEYHDELPSVSRSGRCCCFRRHATIASVVTHSEEEIERGLELV